MTTHERPLAFRKVTAGHYINNETGVEIVKVDRQRIGRSGHRVAGWSITAPAFAEGHLSRSEVGFETTKAAATIPATRIALAAREQTAIAYANAAREDVARTVADIYLNKPVSETAARYAIIAHKSLALADWDRARSWANEAAREHKREQAKAADEARRTYLTSRAAGDIQDEALRSRAFRHPAYNGNRLTRSHEVSMQRAITAAIADDHAEALRDNTARTVAADPGLAPAVDGPSWYRLTANEHYAAAVLRTFTRPGGGTMAAAMAELHDEALREHYARLSEEHGHGLPADRMMRMQEWLRSPGRVRYLLLAENMAYEEAERRAPAVVVGDLSGNAAWVDDVRARWNAYELTSGEAVEKLMTRLGVTNDGATELLYAE